MSSLFMASEAELIERLEEADAANGADEATRETRRFWSIFLFTNRIQ